GPVHSLLLERFAKGGIDQAVKRRRVQEPKPAPGQDADDGLEQRARQVLGSSLKVVDIYQASVAIVLGPARQAREQMALADAGLPPQHASDSTPRVPRLSSKRRQALELFLMDGFNVHVGRRRRVDAIVGEWVGRQQLFDEIR